VVSAGSYILSAALLVVLALSLGFSAVRLRQRFMPEWEGAPGRLVEAIVGVALLIWLSELLGVVNVLYAGTVVAASVLLAAAVALGPRVLSRGEGGLADSPVRTPPPPAPPAGEAFLPGGGGDLGDHPEEQPHRRGGGTKSATGPAGPGAMSVIAVVVIAVVFAHWGLTTADALSRGVFNFDSLWYHLPFAVEMAHSHSVTGLHYTETVFTNWFYPQNSELLHGVGILLTHRDTLSLFLNFGWLAIAFLAAWCIGRPYGRAPLTVIAAAVLLECHTLVVREPGAAKNDLMAAALLLAAIAILINAAWGAHLPRVAWGRGAGRARRPLFRPNQDLGRPHDSEAKNPAPDRHPSPATGPAAAMLPIAVAGLATGMAVGTKSTALAMAAALTVAVVFLAPAGRRWVATWWWFAAALAGGGYWYLRNLVISGNPLPQLEHLGPISLPHPEHLQSGRPDFSIAHYATDTGVWSDYFAPGLHQAFGILWPLVILAAIASGLLALIRGQSRTVRWMGGVALFGMLAYVFTPLSAAGAEGAPEGFGINIRYAIPALLAGIALLPLALGRWATASSAGGVGEGSRGGAASSFSPQQQSRTAAERPGGKPSAPPGPLPDDRTRGWAIPSLLLIAFLVVLVITDRPDAILRDPDRFFAWMIALLFVLIPATLLFARSRGASRAIVAGGFVALTLAVVAIGYPVQRDYLGDRFANADPDTSIPGMQLDSAYRWARDVEDSRIGLAGTTAGFLEYGFYGTDLSNRVRYLGAEGPHGAFDAVQTCAGFRAAVNAAGLDYLVTAPFLNFIEPGEPVPSPEAGWLRGEPAVGAIDREGAVTVWRVLGRLDPAGCGRRNRPLRAVPQQPGAPAAIEEAGPILDRNAIAILGDSYSAGEGADVYFGESETRANPCHRSPFTYLAREFDVPASRIVACSGAVAADVLSPQPGRTVASQVVQLERIRRREGVDAVVLTLGGNDAGFADVGASCLVRRESCARLVYTGPPGRLRPQASNAFVERRLGALPAALRRAYGAIDYAVNGPRARAAAGPVPILVLGYPAATPAAPVDCGRMHGLISAGEIVFLNDLSRRLNGTIAQTVAEVRAGSGAPIFYVGETEGAFRPDHTVCDRDPWVRTPTSFNGAGRALLDRLGQGVRELLHPNPAGYAAMSRAVLRWSRSGAADRALSFLESAPPAERPPALTSAG
jgi:lysophospholipase L1-like esterase